MYWQIGEFRILFMHEIKCALILKRDMSNIVITSYTTAAAHDHRYITFSRPFPKPILAKLVSTHRIHRLSRLLMLVP